MALYKLHGDVEGLKGMKHISQRIGKEAKRKRWMALHV